MITKGQVEKIYPLLDEVRSDFDISDVFKVYESSLRQTKKEIEKRVKKNEAYREEAYAAMTSKAPEFKKEIGFKHWKNEAGLIKEYIVDLPKKNTAYRTTADQITKVLKNIEALSLQAQGACHDLWVAMDKVVHSNASIPKDLEENLYGFKALIETACIDDQGQFKEGVPESVEKFYRGVQKVLSPSSQKAPSPPPSPASSRSLSPADGNSSSESSSSDNDSDDMPQAR